MALQRQPIWARKCRGAWAEFHKYRGETVHVQKEEKSLNKIYDFNTVEHTKVANI
jgi:hypothetical protein